MEDNDEEFLDVYPLPAQECTDAMDILPIIKKALDNLTNADKNESFMKLIRSIADGKLPLNNISFELFFDVVNWFSVDDTRSMRYSPSTLKFFWLGRKLFGCKFVRFMSGPRNETDLLSGLSTLSPLNSKINFACPKEDVLREINPLGQDFPSEFESGLIESMIKLKSKGTTPEKSFIIMFDGKKVKRGGDVDLLGFEDGPSLNERQNEHDFEMNKIAHLIRLTTEVSRCCRVVDRTPDHYWSAILKELKESFVVLSSNLKNLRLFKKKKNAALSKLKKQSDKGTSASYMYAIDFCKTAIYQAENCIDTLLEVVMMICRVGASINKVGHLFFKKNPVVLEMQQNVHLLKSPDEMKSAIGVLELAPELTKQRSPEWYEARKAVKVTGSTIHTAIGCDTLKSQKAHFDRFVSGIEPIRPTKEQAHAMEHGTKCEVHEIATLSSIVLPFLFPDCVYREEGYYLNDRVLISPDGSLVSDTNEFAFEGKAPMGNDFVTPVHYSVPARYITQTIFEQKALNAKRGTLYLSWSEESSAVHIIPVNKKLCTDILNQIDELYHDSLPKRPTSISKHSKQLKENIKNFVSKCEFVGEFPSVKGVIADESQHCNDGECSSPTYEMAIKLFMKAKQALEDAYQLQRQYASQVVVFLLADLDRLWKQEEPHAVPVMFFFRGYSLSMDIFRKIHEQCKKACLRNGIDVIVYLLTESFFP